MNNEDFITSFVRDGKHGKGHGNLRTAGAYASGYVAGAEKLGTVLYSYATPIAIRTPDGMTFWSARTFSNTTARHLSILNAACTYRAELPSGIIPRSDIRAISARDLADAIGIDVYFLCDGMTRRADPANVMFLYCAEYNDAKAETVRIGSVWDRVAASARPVWQRATAWEYRDGRASFTAHIGRVGTLRVLLLDDHAVVHRAMESYAGGQHTVTAIGEATEIDTSGMTWPRGTRRENRQRRIAEQVAEVFGNTLQFPDSVTFYRPE